MGLESDEVPHGPAFAALEKKVAAMPVKDYEELKGSQPQEGQEEVEYDVEPGSPFAVCDLPWHRRCVVLMNAFRGGGLPQVFDLMCPTVSDGWLDKFVMRRVFAPWQLQTQRSRRQLSETRLAKARRKIAEGIEREQTIKAQMTACSADGELWRSRCVKAQKELHALQKEWRHMDRLKHFAYEFEAQKEPSATRSASKQTSEPDGSLSQDSRQSKTRKEEAEAPKSHAKSAALPGSLEEAAGIVSHQLRAMRRRLVLMKGFEGERVSLRRAVTIIEDYMQRTCQPLEFGKKSVKYSDAGGWNDPELKQGEYSAKEMREAGFPVPNLVKLGYSLKQLKASGVTALEFKELGHGIRDLKKAGYSRDEIKACGFQDFNDFYPAFDFESELLLDGKAGAIFSKKCDSEDLPGPGMPYTIEAWVKPSANVGQGGICGWGDFGQRNLCNGFRFEGPQKLVNHWWGNDVEIQLSSSLADGNWHHVACNWNGTRRRIFVDFHQVLESKSHGHSAKNFNSPGQFQNLMVGNWCTGAEPFKGGIKDVFIWTHALDDAKMRGYASWLQQCRDRSALSNSLDRSASSPGGLGKLDTKSMAMSGWSFSMSPYAAEQKIRAAVPVLPKSGFFPKIDGAPPAAAEFPRRGPGAKKAVSSKVGADSAVPVNDDVQNSVDVMTSQYKHNVTPMIHPLT